MMIMKRNILAVILLICACFGAYGQDTTPIDLVLLLDTSSDMSSSYENVNNYITGGFLSEFLRTGDTFHLIPFSANPRLDAARRISSVGDVETIIGRMLLQYPVENGNNIAAAVAYAEQYIRSLPARPKKIVLVSTGGSDTNNLVNAARQRLNSANTTLDFVQVTPGQPLTDLPRSGRPAVAARTTTVTPATPAATTATTSTPVTPATGATTTAPATPAATSSTAATPAATSAAATAPTTPSAAATTTTQRQPDSAPEETGTASRAGGVQETVTPQGTAATGTVATGSAATGTATTGTATTGAADTSADQTGRSSGQTEVQNPAASAGTSGTGRETTASVSGRAFPVPIVIGIILLLLLLGLIIFFASRRLGSSPNRVMAEATSAEKRDDSSQFADHSKDLAKYAAVQTRQRTTPYSNRPVKPENGKPVTINSSGPLLINMFVEDQNTAIGKRNIHSLKSGYSLTVGGGKSDFLIFLVPVPPSIGELRRNGSQLSFIPRKPKYFPDLGSGELRDCLNKTIRVISDKNYELRFRFETYEDPLIALNQMLMSIKVPG